MDVQEELDGVLIGLQPYLYYYYSGCTLESHGHMSFPECSMVTCPCHVTCLTKSLSCLCLYSVVCLEVLVGVFRCMGNLFLLEVLTTCTTINENSIEFSLLTQTRSSSKTSQSKSLHTPFHISLYFLCCSWPPEIPSDQFYCFLLFSMSSHWCIVV